jgi:ATP-binding cassette, subfamily F, member 3
MALNEFEGTVMLVSHDRALLRAVCDEFWLVGRGQVQPFDGDLDDYQRYLLEEARRLREEARAENKAAAAAAPPASDFTPQEQRRLDALQRQQLAVRTKPLKRELERTNRRMAELTTARAELEARLASPRPPGEIAEAGRQLKVVNDELEALEERWFELSSEIEAIEIVR